MKESLKHIFETIHQVQTEAEIRSQIVPLIGEYFVATRWGIFFFNSWEEMLQKYLPSLDYQLQQLLKNSLSIKNNPVVRYLVENHAPVHESIVTSPKIWQIICPRPDHRHVMIGPIINQGNLIGVIACTREQKISAFNSQNLADLSAICLHLSVTIATKKSPQLLSLNQPNDLYKTKQLTPREIEIADLVALGLTNTEIAAKLWITPNTVKQTLKRMFRKLEVSSRTEMTTQLLIQFSLKNNN